MRRATDRCPDASRLFLFPSMTRFDALLTTRVPVSFHPQDGIGLLTKPLYKNLSVDAMSFSVLELGKEQNDLVTNAAFAAYAAAVRGDSAGTLAASASAASVLNQAAAASRRRRRTLLQAGGGGAAVGTGDDADLLAATEALARSENRRKLALIAFAGSQVALTSKAWRTDSFQAVSSTLQAVLNEPAEVSIETQVRGFNSLICKLRRGMLRKIAHCHDGNADPFHPSDACTYVFSCASAGVRSRRAGEHGVERDGPADRVVHRLGSRPRGDRGAVAHQSRGCGCVWGPAAGAGDGG